MLFTKTIIAALVAVASAQRFTVFLDETCDDANKIQIEKLLIVNECHDVNDLDRAKSVWWNRGWYTHVWAYTERGCNGEKILLDHRSGCQKTHVWHLDGGEAVISSIMMT